MITDNSLKQIMPKLPDAKRAVYLPFLQRAMTEFAVNVPRREAAFLAQVAHESGEFRWMEEIWGPTPAQKKYEPPSDTATKLGNTQPGDGKRFKGRGPIQITGRANYAKYGGLLGLDLVNNPERAATPEVGFRVAGLFWQRNGLNELADREMFETITRRINGGLNGYQDRLKYYTRAKQVLGLGTTRPLLEPAAESDPSPFPEFTRGREVIGAEPPRRRPTRKVKRTSKKSTTKKAAPKTGRSKKKSQSKRKSSGSKKK
jgi:predicted chitinase